MGSKESTMATAHYELLTRARFGDAELDQVTGRCDTVLDIQVTASTYQVLNELLSVARRASVIRKRKCIYKEGK